MKGLEQTAAAALVIALGLGVAQPGLAAGAGDVYSVPGTYAPAGSGSASPLPSPYASAPTSEPRVA